MSATHLTQGCFIEYQMSNKEPQHYEEGTSTFDILLFRKSTYKSYIYNVHGLMCV